MAAAILDPDLGPVILENAVKAKALVTELAMWNANRYIFSKEFTPTLLNNALNEFPYPFRDAAGKTRQEACTYYFYEQEAWFADNIERMIPSSRIFPTLKYEIIFRNDKAALILVEGERYGSDDLIAQLYFQSNPQCVRVILVRKVYKSVKHLMTITNSNMFTPELAPYTYPNVKELNLQEKKADGDPSWKNLKLTTIGPRKGTALPFDLIWDLTKVDA